jgi:hypothetical protein
MTGNMPFHLEKGPLGLRMDYMAKIPAVRTAALALLNGQADPWAIGTALVVNGVTISLFNDNRNVFADKLNALAGGVTVEIYGVEMLPGDGFLAEQALLRPFNRDSTGNRNKFTDFWEDAKTKNPELVAAVRTALTTALGGEVELDVWWECTLADDADPGVHVSTEFEEVTRLMFRTDHSPIAEETPGQVARPPDP